MQESERWRYDWKDKQESTAGTQRRSLSFFRMLQHISNGELCGYFQCEIVMPENMRANYSNSRLFSKKLFS